MNGRWHHGVVGLLPALFALGLMGAFAAGHWPLWEPAFFSDNSPAAWLSSAQLLGGFYLSLRLLHENRLPRRWGLVLVVGMGWMTTDEQFMLHEQWKYGCAEWWPLCHCAAVRDAPIWGIGVVGALTTWGLWRHLPSRSGRRLLAGGVALGLLALWVDLTQTPAAWVALEEALEVMAQALFLGALLVWPGKDAATPPPPGTTHPGGDRQQ